MAGASPQSIDFAEIHDAFTPFEIITSEDLGFFPPGKGGEAALDGKTALGGSLPINPSGGLKARGHPVGASGLAQIVEGTKTLRGQSHAKRAFQRGLTQSTGGLGTNNFVTILERSDAVQKGPAAAFPMPTIAVHKKSQPPRASDEGEIETFTILYVTPDGFLPPLALALVRQRNGRLIMAQGEDSEHLKIGREVYLRRTDDYCLFTVKSQLQKVQESLKKLLRRKPSSPAQGQNQMDDKS
jgi:hypothetical protein